MPTWKSWIIKPHKFNIYTQKKTLINNSNFIIVGHGIAGALLGYCLEQAGQSCRYFDAPDQVAATSVAAGIINPITGRRFVKSWRIEALLPAAQQIYRQLEVELGIHFYHERPLLRTLFNRGEENDWQARSLDMDYASYFHAPPDLGSIPLITAPAFSYLEVAQAAQVHIGQLVAALRLRREQAGLYHAETFDFAALETRADGIGYRQFTADQIVFCEGWHSRANPYFNYLPFGGNKGEVLLIRLPEAKLEQILKHRLFLVPYTEDLYWVGSTSENQFTTAEPTTAGGEYLRGRLAELLTTPYEIIDHRAAIRPTVRDRRPFLGTHPTHSRVHIFNGLGTKGASLAPYWATHLADHLIAGTPLDPEVDIKRFGH